MNKILSEESRYKLLKALEENPSATQRELAQELEMSLGKLNYCLKALVEKGWVKVGNFKRNQHKIGYAYLLTPKGIEEKTNVTIGFLKRKLEEYDKLQDEIKCLREEVSDQYTD